MCGIVGYVVKRAAVPILVEGLRRLEYRGYDLAGSLPRRWPPRRPQEARQDRRGPGPRTLRARQGPIIAVTTRGNDRIAEFANDVLRVPATLEPLQPLLNVIPLQLLAYHVAVARGCDVDKPRNLAKSVTVE